MLNAIPIRRFCTVVLYPTPFRITESLRVLDFYTSVVLCDLLEAKSSDISTNLDDFLSAVQECF